MLTNTESVLFEAIRRWREQGYEDDFILSTAYRMKEEQKGETGVALVAHREKRT